MRSCLLGGVLATAFAASVLGAGLFVGVEMYPWNTDQEESTLTLRPIYMLGLEGPAGFPYGVTLVGYIGRDGLSSHDGWRIWGIGGVTEWSTTHPIRVGVGFERWLRRSNSALVELYSRLTATLQFVVNGIRLFARIGTPLDMVVPEGGQPAPVGCTTISFGIHCPLAVLFPCR